MHSPHRNWYWAHPNSLTVYIVDGHEVAHVTTVSRNVWDDAYFAHFRGSPELAQRFDRMNEAKAYVEATCELTMA